MNVNEDYRPAHSLALRPGTLLEDRYRIARLLGGSSPFALTYLARDGATGEDLILKEFLPRQHVSRPGPGPELRAHTPDDERTFSRMRRAFLREAELVADRRHPALPAIRDAFDSHGTACWVATPGEGVALAELVASAGGRLTTANAAAVVSGLLDALAVLHAEGVLHGHVAPENVRVTPDLQPLLLGIGTTRHVLGNAKEPNPAYAPIEQYASAEVGPWTDVHACGALLYALLVGAPPPTAIERAGGRPLVMPPQVAATLPPALVRAILAALAPTPADRPHSAMELRRRIEEAGDTELPATPAVAPAPRATTTALTEPAMREAPSLYAEPAPLSERTPAEPSSLLLVVPSRDGLLPDAAVPDGPRPAAWLEALGDVFDEPPLPERWPTRLRRTLAAVVTKDAPSRLLHAMRGHSATAAVVLALLLLSFGSIAAIAAIVRDGTAGGSLDGTVATEQKETPRTTPPAAPVVVATTVANDSSLLPLDSIAEGRVGIGLAGEVAAPATTAPAEPDPAASGPADFRVTVPSAPLASVAIPSRGGAPAELPFAMQNELREHVAQAALKVEFGDYVGALRAYRVAADRVAALDSLYPASPVLAATRRDVAQAMALTRRACIAESTIRQARSETALACG